MQLICRARRRRRRAEKLSLGAKYESHRGIVDFCARPKFFAANQPACLLHACQCRSARVCTIIAAHMSYRMKRVRVAPRTANKANRRAIVFVCARVCLRLYPIGHLLASGRSGQTNRYSAVWAPKTTTTRRRRRQRASCAAKNVALFVAQQITLSRPRRSRRITGDGGATHAIVN